MANALNAKNVPFSQSGAGLELMGVNDRNVWAKYDKLRGVRDQKEGGSRQLWNNLSRWTSTPQGKNLDPNQASLFNQYINTGTRPDGLTDKTALAAMDWGGREAGRFQQHKPVNFFTEYLMDPLIQAGLTIATGNPYLAMAYGGIKGGVEDGGFGAIKGIASGYTAGNAGAGLWNAGKAAGGVSGFFANPGQWASTLGSNAVTGVKNSVGNLLGNGGGGCTNTGALGINGLPGANFASMPGAFPSTLNAAGFGNNALGISGQNLGLNFASGAIKGLDVAGYGNSAIGGDAASLYTPQSMGPPKPSIGDRILDVVGNLPGLPTGGGGPSGGGGGSGPAISGPTETPPMALPPPGAPPPTNSFDVSLMGAGKAPANALAMSGMGAGLLPDRRMGRVPGYQLRPFANYMMRP